VKSNVIRETLLKMEVDGAKDVSQANQLMNLRKVRERQIERERERERWSKVDERCCRRGNTSTQYGQLRIDLSHLGSHCQLLLNYL
jgi:hypothetical protein